MKRREPKYCGDIDSILAVPFGVDFTLLVICALLFIVCYFAQTNAEDVKTYNAQAKAFNALPRAEREIMQPFCSEDLSEEDLIIEFKDPPQSFDDLLKMVFPWFIRIELVLFVILTFGCYWHEKGKSYHLADLPLRSIYGWVILLIILPVGWPFLLCSRLIMWFEARDGKKAEKLELKQLAKISLTLEKQPSKPIFSERAKNLYLKFRTENALKAKISRESKLRQQIADQKADIVNYGKRISELQREIGKKQAELKELENSTLAQNNSKSAALSEWEQILHMRGIAEVTASRRNAKDKGQFVRVTIHVRVPYRNNLYDFGDYEVTFFKDHFQSRQLRSGVRKDASTTRPTYRDDHYGFCFGSRLSTIETYARNGRIIEALTIIIDCLHSVNSGDEEYIPRCYRKVEIIERTKQRLKLQKLFQRR